MAAPGSVVQFYRHQVGDEEAASFRRVVDSLFLTLGPEVAAFEGEMGAFLVRGRCGAEAPIVVGTSSCSMGLLIALRALDVGPGDEVVTTPMTFASTVTAILLAGATPVLVDVEPATGAQRARLASRRFRNEPSVRRTSQLWPCTEPEADATAGVWSC